MTPTIIHLDSMVLRGLARRFTPETMQGISQLWAEAVPHLHDTPGSTGDAVYGVTLGMEMADGRMLSFDYMPAIEVTPGSAAPEWSTTAELPAGKYAMFTYDGHISGLPEWMGKVWREGLPASGLKHRNAQDFERYDERWHSETGTGPVDYYIPVE